MTPVLRVLTRTPLAARFSTTPRLPSGHNRWSKIRHKKGAADAQRSVLFSKLISEITTSLRPPASLDPSINSRLGIALEKARQAGVPKVNVENAFHRARSTANGGQNVTYEAVIHGRIGIIIECTTDNPARCVQQVKEVLHKYGARIAPVSFLFERKGLILVEPHENVFEKAVDAGAEDVREGDPYEVITSPESLSTIAAALDGSPELVYIPITSLTPTPTETETIPKLIDSLEELPDVIRVWTNVD